jgi:hypothetical protein
MTAFDLRAVAWSATQSRFQLGCAPFRTFPRRVKQSSFLAKCRGFRIWGSAVAACTLLVACFLNAWLADVLAQPLGSKQQQLAQSRPDQAQAEPTPPGQSKPQGKTSGALPSVPPDDVLLILIRASLIALHQANVTNNYSVLRDIAAPSFKERNTVEQLAKIFTKLRERNLDLAQTLVVTPKLYRKSEITPKGMLRITGFFPVEPERINFDFVFQPVQGRWRLLALQVTTGEPRQRESLQVAPEAARQPAAAAPQDSAPAAPAAVAKPEAAETKTNSKKVTSESDIDIRDRIGNPPAPPPPPAEEKQQNSFWNPFSR